MKAARPLYATTERPMLTPSVGICYVTQARLGMNIFSVLRYRVISRLAIALSVSPMVGFPLGRVVVALG